MSNVLAFVSIKGGVGKTTLALETATALANKFDKRVLLVDANFSAPNVGLYLDLTSDLTLHDALSGIPMHNAIYEKNNVDVIPSSMYYDGDEADIFKLKRLLAKFKKRYDFIILDSSPNFEELKPVINAADKIFVVTTPDHVTLSTSLKAAKLAKEQNTPIHGIVVNKIRSPKHEYHIDEIENISEIPVVAKIRDHKKMVEALKNKTPISVYDEKNPITKEVEHLASAICGTPENYKDSFLYKLLPFKGLIGKERVNRDFLRQKFYE